MSTESFLKATCPKCKGTIEFPREALRDTAPCPHCGAEVLLTTSQTAPTRVPILIGQGKPLSVPECATATILVWVGVLQLVFAVIALVTAGLPSAIALALGGIFTIAFAKLIQCAHDTAQRLARLEVFFQSSVNERR